MCLSYSTVRGISILDCPQCIISFGDNHATVIDHLYVVFIIYLQVMMIVQDSKDWGYVSSDVKYQIIYLIKITINNSSKIII